MDKFHVRSTSMPSRSHPITLKVEEEMHKLKADLTTSSASSSAMEMSSCLGGLGGLYDSIGELLQLPTIQQSLVNPIQKKWLEKKLDESVRLLDLCGTTKEVLTTIQDQIQQFQLGMRKRGQRCTDEVVRAYISSNKDAQKIVMHAQHQLQKQANNKCDLVSPTDCYGDDDLSMAKKVLKEAIEITTSVLNSILSYLSMQGIKPKSCKWPFVSKALHKKASRKVEPMEASANWCIEAPFDATPECISLKELEAGLECLFRRLIQTRVSLLNFVSL